MKSPVKVSALFVCLTTVIIIKHNSASNQLCEVFQPAMNRINLQGSVKNIPIPSYKVYYNMFINSIETLVREMGWAAQLYLNPSSKTTKRTFNFRSINNPKRLRELDKFKSDLVKIVKNIQFRKYNNSFQRKIHDDKRRIQNSNNVIVHADKTSNLYEVTPSDYKKLVQKEVNEEYKKVTSRTMDKINMAHKKIVSNLELQDRVMKTTERECFISFKDHKSDFINKPKCRLLDPFKCEVGRISHLLLKDIVKVVREKSKLNQWKNVYSCIEWFKKLNHKSSSSFIVYDIVNFYPSINEDLLNAALDWAEQFTSISIRDRDIIRQARKSLLYFDNSYWTKKKNPNFDVPMGSYDGAEVCDIVGLFLLAELEKQNLRGIFGSYKDDGLGVSHSTPRGIENIKKKICETYKKHGLQVTIEANKKCVQFLDAEFNLSDGTFKPYLKPGDTPLYVHADSNHPPGILKNIPKSINKRLSALSSNEEMFLSVAPIYQNALDQSGYKYKLKYEPPPPTPNTPNKRQRKRRVIWWNPPYSANVKTNVGKLFFAALEENFGKDNPLNKIFNKRTVKMSYRTVPNFKKIISSHNKKLTKGVPEDPPCNCHNKDECPLDGQCNRNNIVYQATVTPSVGPVETYIGMTKNTFKERQKDHRKSVKHLKWSTETTYSTFIWELKKKNVDFSVQWQIVDRAPPYNPVTRVCALCTLEKYYILFQPERSSLNKNEEIYKPCPHKPLMLLAKT